MPSMSAQSDGSRTWRDGGGSPVRSVTAGHPWGERHRSTVRDRAGGAGRVAAHDRPDQAPCGRMGGYGADRATAGLVPAGSAVTIHLDTSFLILAMLRGSTEDRRLRALIRDRVELSMNAIC